MEPYDDAVLAVSAYIESLGPMGRQCKM